MSAESQRPPVQLIALIALVYLEAAVLAVAACLLLVDLVMAEARDARSAVALAVTTALFALGVAVLAYGLHRRWVRIRGGVLLWQLLQVACAVGAFQGLLGPTWTGWLLLVPAGVAIWLLFTRPVTAIFAARDAEVR